MRSYQIRSLRAPRFRVVCCALLLLGVGLSGAGRVAGEPAATAPATAAARCSHRLPEQRISGARPDSQLGVRPQRPRPSGTPGKVTGRQCRRALFPTRWRCCTPTTGTGASAFDEQRYADLQRLAGPLRESHDPFLAANARYLYTRALIEQGLLEEAETELSATGAADADLVKYTPYAPHLRFIRAYCQASGLQFDEALQTLQALQSDCPDAPEPVQAGARQLRLEIERRERGTLDEVASLMSYSAARLKVADATQRVRLRQDEAVAARQTGRRGAAARETAGRREPAPRGAGEAAALGGAGVGAAAVGPGADRRPAPRPAADPGEMWGQLPPAQRERILDSLRDRFPSRYRQLVEQYYRSLAEEK